MNKVYKIVTSRNTSFSEGEELDGVVVVSINLSFSFMEDGIIAFLVEFSDGTHVEVHDVAEEWVRPMTHGEEEEYKKLLIGMPFESQIQN